MGFVQIGSNFNIFVGYVKLIKSFHRRQPLKILVFAPGLSEDLYILYEEVQKNRIKFFFYYTCACIKCILMIFANVHLWF